ncbi:MAG: phage holin family protein [Candidatus Dormibacteraeota bacterium]|uniref:Phage holin family protein n=1 Tax=Candidatus Dormiibacter inghamiae TaxID=3127013 RepID=A0A934K927_9BACT|nr:phage holin family protein [Candidatus Dormibacteraeota bacterium]MBJ7605621.1 phage holin family protein [Candidatus Dormibacteraeota bacterium]
MANVTEDRAADLAQDVVRDAQRLIQQEISLAKMEGKELAARDGVAVGLMVVGGLLLLFGLLVGIAFLVTWLLNTALAGLIACAVYLVLGAILALVGKSRLVIPKPAELRSVANLKETRDWVLRQIRSNVR